MAGSRMTAATGEGRLWSAYSGAAARAKRIIRELSALEPAVLRASYFAGRRHLVFLCSEVPLNVRRDNVRRLAEETLAWTVDTQACVHALATLDRSDVVPVLPELAEALYRAAQSDDENLDSDCGAALQLLWLYGEHRLLDLVLPALAAKTEWTMGNVAEGFLDRYGQDSRALVGERERHEFEQRARAHPAAAGAADRPDRETIEKYRPLWDELWAAWAEIGDLNKQIKAAGPDSVLAYAVRTATPDEQPAVARLINGHYGKGKPRKLAEAVAIVGDEFVPKCLPWLLERAATNCYVAPEVYHDLRAVFEAERRPDLADKVSRAEWSAYGRHDGEGRLVELRP